MAKVVFWGFALLCVVGAAPVQREAEATAEADEGCGHLCRITKKEVEAAAEADEGCGY